MLDEPCRHAVPGKAEACLRPPALAARMALRPHLLRARAGTSGPENAPGQG